jgi:flagellar hook-length control protein FliK
MAVQNPTSIKSNSATQATQRKISEPIETDFDALLTGSIGEVAETDKDTHTDKLSSAEEKGTDAQSGIALPFPALPAALQAELADGGNPLFAGGAGPLQQSDADQSKQSVPGITVLDTNGPNSPNNQQKHASSIALVTLSNPFNAELPVQYSKNTTGSLFAVSRAATTDSEAVSAPGVEVKDHSSDHRLSSLSSLIGDSNTINPKTVAEPGVTLLTNNTTPVNSAEATASIGSIPANVGLTDQRTDLSIAGASGDKEITSIQSAIGSTQWAEEASQTIHLLVKQNHQQAEIKVNPVELGPIEIQIAMVQGEASISFVAEHGETRNALEVALPRLKELLADSGISLAGAFVGSDRQPRQQPARAPFKDSISDSSTGTESSLLGASILRINAFNKPGVDVYA